MSADREAGKSASKCLTSICRFKGLLFFLVLSAIGFVIGGCGDSQRSIDRIQKSSPLHSIPFLYSPGKEYALANALRHDLPKGTSLDGVRRYMKRNFVDDGHLILEDTVTSKKTDIHRPPRIHLKLYENYIRFAGSGSTDLIFYFDDHGDLDGVAVHSNSSYL